MVATVDRESIEEDVLTRVLREIEGVEAIAGTETISEREGIRGGIVLVLVPHAIKEETIDLTLKLSKYSFVFYKTNMITLFSL